MRHYKASLEDIRLPKWISSWFVGARTVGRQMINVSTMAEQ